ncbi:protein NRT1/ PTR FAMILY 2.7-like [Nicotiana tomentosiformis]|uniref:protein NRT1/ PTR FAMILY 2.7-like n=1 Tax=Nicotiana tomentosiformis TaxID=4098 RepID=UPI00051BA757|nr:protein NRT1/ PTR FAMILY 2.7-like [Nicotiana tomentosiformis]
MEKSKRDVDEAAMQSSSGRKNGGWITFPFIIATMAGLSLASGGWNSNLIVFLINEFNMKSIKAAKVYNVVNGCTTLFPILGGIIADSYLGCFSVIWISSLISALGILFLLLTAAIDVLRPAACDDGSSLCTSPSKHQYAVLYVAMGLASLGVAGTRFTIAPMGANQFDNPKHQAIFFDWYIFAFYTSFAISTTAIVYVEDNISWSWGFGISLAFNILGLAMFLIGKRFYRHVKEQGGSPFVNLARCIVAAIRKWRVPLSEQTQSYYHDPSDTTTITTSPVPTKFFKFLNNAAFITEGDTKSDGSIRNPWRLCTVQQVEDLKSLIKLFPLWASGLLISTQLVMQSSLLILQALKMDRHMGPHFEIPAGSMLVFIMLFTCIMIAIIDRLLYPFLAKYTHFSITPLQRIGIGHVLTIVSMAVSALVESRRLRLVRSHHLQGQNGAIVSMSVFWLVPQLALNGIGEGFHFPGHMGFYYQEFPASLKSTSTAMVALFIGIAYYIGNGLIDLVQRLAGWLPDNINDGRMDNVFWLCCVLGSANFIYYLVFSSLYKYKNMDNKPNDVPSK